MYDQLLLEINRLQKNPLTFIGIDGPGGVGKTTLANVIKKNLKGVQIVHMDDFDVLIDQKMRVSENRPVGPDTKWERVLQEVLLPLKQGNKSSYKRYDRKSDSYRKILTIKPTGIIVVEGVFAVRRELFSHYDFTVWVECSFEKRVKRALERDGEISRALWEKDWIPMEEMYINVYKPQEYADFVLRTD